MKIHNNLVLDVKKSGLPYLKRKRYLIKRLLKTLLRIFVPIGLSSESGGRPRPHLLKLKEFHPHWKFDVCPELPLGQVSHTIQDWSRKYSDCGARPVQIGTHHHIDTHRHQLVKKMVSVPQVSRVIDPSPRTNFWICYWA